MLFKYYHYGVKHILDSEQNNGCIDFATMNVSTNFFFFLYVNPIRSQNNASIFDVFQYLFRWESECSFVFERSKCPVILKRAREKKKGKM